jgi:cell division protease FtsH
MINNDYSNDLNEIYRSKSFFIKEDYNKIIQDITEHKLSKVLINSNYKELVGVSIEENDPIYLHYHLSEVNPLVVNKIVDKGVESNVPIYFVDFTSPLIQQTKNMLNEITNSFGFIMPIIFLYFFINIIFNIIRANMNNSNIQSRRNNMNQSGFNPFGFNMEKKNVDQFVKPNVYLSSWAGSEEVIEECKEVISYLEKKESYKEIGAEMPKGILLEGPPGTGKTLLAKAIATETNSTFIPMSGSEFVELFVGIGASRVRDLFKKARENSPSIIFIDEIDAIGRQRGAGLNMGNDEREQTLNQLLYEMDGFNTNDNIVVMAATNRKDVLDQALLRPGRFDRIIRVPLPDKNSRSKILDFYLRSKKTNKEFNITSIAELADGFSGAELKNLINEAAILSARNNYTSIQENFIFEAFEKLIVGLIRKNADVSPETKTRVAIHETGHSLLVLQCKQYFDFQKVSIQPTYNGAGGYTIFTEKPEIKEGGLYTKDILKKRLMITMGGKAAETIFYGNDYVSLGAVEDLRQANKLAQKMIGNYGMGNKLEVFFDDSTSDDSSIFLGRKMAMGGISYSERTKFILDKESLELVNEAYQEALQFLTKNKDQMIQFSEILKNNTVLYQKDLIDFIGLE